MRGEGRKVNENQFETWISGNLRNRQLGKTRRSIEEEIKKVSKDFRGVGRREKGEQKTRAKRGSQAIPIGGKLEGPAATHEIMLIKT